MKKLLLVKVKDFLLFVLTKWPLMFVNSLYYAGKKSPLVINSYVKIRNGKLIHQNWGDDINLYLLEKISGRNVVFRNHSLKHYLFPGENYICIGSILGWYENSKSIIWGAGFIREDGDLRRKPKLIKSVRGKFSRNILLAKGYDCPELYGDPALLVSQFYQPKNVYKKHKMGIVAHYVDKENQSIKIFLNTHNDVILIDLVNFVLWTDIIDKIVSCEKIISSSLHGLIVADSYKIPNKWVKFSDKIVGGNFKYLDYFSSVERKETQPIIVDNQAKLDNLYELDFGLNRTKVDFDSILDSCPFKNNDIVSRL